MAMLSKQDHDRSRVAGFTHEIQDFDHYWLEWLIVKLISTLILDWARKLRDCKWSITGWEGRGEDKKIFGAPRW
jgi:hypothetical protein